MNLTTLRKTLGITKGATNYIHSEDYFVRKFRLYPTSEQSQTLTNFYGSIRYVYNKTLGDS